jgi:protocatechuate 3,4-dioxygenase beta subunit
MNRLISICIVCFSVLFGGTAFAQSLSGTVYGGGSPIVTASVDALYDGTTTVAAGTTTDGAGHYTLALAAGTYDLRVTPPTGSGFGQEIIQNVDVNGSVNQDVILLLAQAGTLSGTVTGYGGAPVPGVYVNIYTTAWAYLTQAITDANGYYSISVGGPVNIQLGNTGSTPALTPNSWYCQRYGTNVVGAITADYQLPVAQSTGVVKDPSGNPVPGAYFTHTTSGAAIDANTNCYNNGVSALYSDGVGAFTLVDFISTATWFVSPPNNTLGVYNQSHVVTGDEIFDVVLPTPTTLTGTVTGYNGNPLANVQVQLYSSNWSYVGEVLTDANGVYTINASDGTYNVQVLRSDSSETDAPSYFYCYTYYVTVSGPTVHDVDVPVAAVDGLVSASSGPLANASVATLSYHYDYASGTYCGANSYALSNGSGAYSTMVLDSQATATIGVADYAYNSFFVSPDPVSGFYPIGQLNTITGDTTLDWNIPDPIVVSGQVTGYQGLPVPNGYVYFYTTSWQNYLGLAYPDANGFYSVTMSPGSYNIQLGGNDYTYSYAPQSWYCQDYPYSASASTTKDFVLPVAAVEGDVTDSNYAPVPGVGISTNTYAYDYNTGHYCYGSFSGTTDAAGHYVSRQFSGPNTSGHSDYTNFYFVPPTLSGFAQANLQGVLISGDLNQAIVLQHPDNVPPVIISGPTVIHISDDTVSINWSTDEPSTSVVDFGLGVISQTASQPGLVTTHSVTLTGLAVSSIYAYSVSSTDASGNGPTSSPVQYFTTQDPPGDITPPVFTSGPTVSFVSQTSAIITWTTDEPTDEVLSWGLSPSLSNLHTGAPGLFVQVHTVTLNGLTASTLYTYQVAATDPDGNGPTLSGVLSFTTASVPDTTPPVILSGPNATAVTDTSITISWTTDEPSDSGVSYNDGTVYGLVNDPTLVTTHTQTISGLTPSTPYFITVSSTDPVGNGPTLGGVLTVTTLATPDTTAPVLSNVTVSNITTSTATITWTTDESATENVDFGLAGGPFTGTSGNVTLQTSHSVLLTGLSQNTAYDFVASSADSSNNVGVSPTLSFTTLPNFTCLTITDVPGNPTLVQDAMIVSDPLDPTRAGANYAGTIIQIGTVGTATFRMLLKYDLGAIPTGSSIVSSTISLRKAHHLGPGGIVNLHTLFTAWSEGTVTWNTIGSSYDPTVLATFLPASYANNTNVSIDITALTQSWWSGALANNGLLLEELSGSRSIYGASEAVPANRPTLMVCYN